MSCVERVHRRHPICCSSQETGCAQLGLQVPVHVLHEVVANHNFEQTLSLFAQGKAMLVNLLSQCLEHCNDIVFQRRLQEDTYATVLSLLVDNTFWLCDLSPPHGSRDSRASVRSGDSASLSLGVSGATGSPELLNWDSYVKVPIIRFRDIPRQNLLL